MNSQIRGSSVSWASAEEVYKQHTQKWTRCTLDGLIQPYPVAQKQNHIYWNFLLNLNWIEISFQWIWAFNSQ